MQQLLSLSLKICNYYYLPSDVSGGSFFVIENSAGFPMTKNPPGDATDAHGKYASSCLRASARKEPQAAQKKYTRYKKLLF